MASVLQAQQELCAKPQGAPGGPSGSAAIYQQETLCKDSVSLRLAHHFALERFASYAPACTEPASAPVTRALAGSWLLISVYGVQSLPSLYPTAASSNTQCSLWSPLSLPIQAHTDCSQLWMQTQLPFLAAHDSPNWSHTNCRYALHLQICPQCPSKPLACPSGPV